MREEFMWISHNLLQNYEENLKEERLIANKTMNKWRVIIKVLNK